jgi:uncharacterized protein (TIRG00374 family)
MLPKLAVSIAIGALVAGVAARNGLPLVPSRDALSQIEPWAIPLYVVLLLGTQYLRAVRWRHLIAPVAKVPLRDVIAVNWIGFFAIFALPFRLGEAARPALTKLRHGIPLSVGVGTIAVERVIDGLVTSLCVAWALWVVPMRPTDDPVARHLPAYGTAALVVFSCAFVALFVFLWQRTLAVRLVRGIIGFVSPRLADLLSSKVASVADGLRVLTRPRLALGFLSETLAYWALNAFSMWMLALGCGLPLEFAHAIAIMGVLAIGILLPAGPGMFGSFQLAVSAALTCYLTDAMVAREGSAYVFVLYVTQAIVLALCGIVPLYRMRLRFEDVLGNGENAADRLQTPERAP